MRGDKSTPSALLEFRSPIAGELPTRLAFGPPVEELVAFCPADVVPVIEEAERRARAGAWCIGTLRYEAATAFDMALKTHQPDEGLPLVRFLVYDSELPLAESEAMWRSGESGDASASWCAGPFRANFEQRLATIGQAIANGEIYQVNYTAPLQGRLDGDPLALFAALRRAQPNAYTAYIDGGDGETILSVSPELFFDWRDGRLLAKPMKGTASRGNDAAEDRVQHDRLLASPKERAENVMIVDLLRNDMSRVASLHTVKTARLFEAEAWPTVWQLTSEVSCMTREDVRLADIFRALFPCGSVTGAPKVNAMKYIRALEETPRGVYCGAVGVIRPGGAATFNVPIRTVVLCDDVLTCGIGSGIVADAVPEAEWLEWRHKRAFVDRASQSFQLLETFRLQEGVCIDISAHLERMADAARHFGFMWHRVDADDALVQMLGSHPDGTWRVRLLSDRNGLFRCEAFAHATMNGKPHVQLASAPLEDTNSEFVRYKTTRRSHYEPFAPTSDQIFDTLLWNEQGQLTEFTRGNLAVQIGGNWLTPSQSCGLLPGVARNRLVREGRLREAIIMRTDLQRATSIAFVNSLRGWLVVELVDPALIDQMTASGADGNA